MCRKYPKQGGQPPAQERNDVPQPQQQSSTGIEQEVDPASIQRVGRQRSPAIEAIVQGDGNKAISFPPMDTIKMSSPPMWSRRNLSCLVKANTRLLSVVASTASYEKAIELKE